MLLKIPNIFTPEINMPEDICFYRNGKLWFATVSHEKLAFIFDAKKEDLKFFLKKGIKVYDIFQENKLIREISLQNIL